MTDLWEGPTESRSHRRDPINIVGTLELLDDGGCGPAFGICVTNVGPGDIGLTLRSDIPVGAKVKLVVQGGVIHGVVAHCEKLPGAFSAGIVVNHDARAIARIVWTACMLPSAHPLMNPVSRGGDWEYTNGRPGGHTDIPDYS